MLFFKNNETLPSSKVLADNKFLNSIHGHIKECQKTYKPTEQHLQNTDSQMRVLCI